MKSFVPVRRERLQKGPSCASRITMAASPSLSYSEVSSLIFFARAAASRTPEPRTSTFRSIWRSRAVR
jgi:hypothetical protein